MTLEYKEAVSASLAREMVALANTLGGRILLGVRDDGRRNPLVADLLHRIGFIEKAGTGIGRMRREARDHGCPEPEFRGDGSVVDENRG